MVLIGLFFTLFILKLSLGLGLCKSKFKITATTVYKARVCLISKSKWCNLHKMYFWWFNNSWLESRHDMKKISDIWKKLTWKEND